MKNKVVRLTKRPNGFPSKETWSNSIDEVREIDKDEILVKNLYVVEDCSGILGGNSLIDECGVCNGDNSSCLDCAGIPNGSSYYDNCGICDSDPLNDCLADCNGLFEGEEGYVSLVDECGVCDSDPSNDCTQDCAGIWGGDLEDDECGVCGGDSSTC